MESDMPEAYIIPAEDYSTMPAEPPGVFAPWHETPQFPAPEFPVDRGAIVEWMHDMIEARLPEGFPLPWEQGGPCEDPGPVTIAM
jgi:hypothetical protein